MMIRKVDIFMNTRNIRRLKKDCFSEPSCCIKKPWKVHDLSNQVARALCRHIAWWSSEKTCIDWAISQKNSDKGKLCKSKIPVDLEKKKEVEYNTCIEYYFFI